jgi:hypothetical protein
MNKIYNADCLGPEGMGRVSDKTIDLKHKAQTRLPLEGIC